MNCPQCGNVIPPGATECPFCHAQTWNVAYQHSNPFGPATNGMAVASLVLGLVGLCVPFIGPLLGLIFGIIALNKINRNPGVWKGSGLAIAGIVISAIGVFFLPVVLASILFPVFAKAREKARQTTCMSQIRQLAIAAQMYDQDNNARYPGVHGANWDAALGTYLGNNAAMFTCPSDSNNSSNINSYGYSGMMVRADGSGVNEAAITAPTEVGVVCDASPSMAYGSGGLVGGGALGNVATTAMIPSPRHSNGTVVGYADGHARYCPNGYNPKDISNDVTRAFYTCNALGLIQNPAGGIGDFTVPTGAGSSTTITIGGDFATMPMLTAAAEAWKAKTDTPYETQGFLGEGAIAGRPHDFLWGYADGNKPKGNAIPIAQDALVFIVSKETKLDQKFFPGPISSGAYSASLDQIGLLLNYADPISRQHTGYAPSVIQAYTYNGNSGNLSFLKHTLHLAVGSQAVVATDDQDMVNKVAADSYGIGYCSICHGRPEQGDDPRYRRQWQPGRVLSAEQPEISLDRPRTCEQRLRLLCPYAVCRDGRPGPRHRRRVARSWRFRHAGTAGRAVVLSELFYTGMRRGQPAASRAPSPPGPPLRGHPPFHKSK